MSPSRDEPDAYQVVYVEWKDAHGGSGQRGRDEVENSSLDFMASAGILIKETEDAVTLVQDAFKHNREPEQVRDFEVIPKVNISYMKVFDVPRKRGEL